jgi:hypothetical protein
MSIFDIIFGGLAAHLLGKDLIHGLDIQARITYVNFTLVLGFALHGTKKRAAFSARLLTLDSFLVEDMLKC